jgi:hypothetical protein
MFVVCSAVQQNGAGFDELPAHPRLDCIGAEQNVDGGDGLLGVAGVTFRRALYPDTGGARLPLLARLSLFAHSRVELPNAHVDNDLVFIRELFLSLALNVHICSGQVCRVQVEVLLDAMPLLLVELAAGQGIERGACLDGDVGDDEAFIVEWQVAVDRLRQHTVAVVEEEYDEEDEKGKHTELNARPHLRQKSVHSPASASSDVQCAGS